MAGGVGAHRGFIIAGKLVKGTDSICRARVQKAKMREGEPVGSAFHCWRRIVQDFDSPWRLRVRTFSTTRSTSVRKKPLAGLPYGNLGAVTECRGDLIPAIDGRTGRYDYGLACSLRQRAVGDPHADGAGR